MQIVGYRTDPTDPGLFVSDAAVAQSDASGDDVAAATTGSVEFVPLAAETDLSYTLGERHCAGTITDVGHRPCRESRAPYCHQHSHTWVCARCTGTCLKDEMDCHDRHAIYLAAFAPDAFKVGVTRLSRLERRLREQGADRGAHVRTVENGRIAREIEAGIAEGIPDRIRLPTKRAGLAAEVDGTAWDTLLEGFDPIDTYAFAYGLGLTERPLSETIATGTVRGVKGRILVLDHADSTYAVDMRDLVGHEITAGATERSLQSSLGAFE